MSNSILLFVLQVLSLNEAFNFSCPSHGHWMLRAKSMCIPPRNYTCLFDVTFRKNVYRDKCSKPRILGAGYKYVFQPNLNRANCSSTRYQPFIFDTIGYSDCSFLKSLCNGIGQVTYGNDENSNNTSDRLCVCDTRKGYTFVKTPDKKCYCNPSYEDCSCYIHITPDTDIFGEKDLKCYHQIIITQSHSIGNTVDTFWLLKINGFDDYNYNKHFPINNRSNAIVGVFISLISYPVVVAVVFILQRFMRRCKKIHSTTNVPFSLKVIQMSDTSITISFDCVKNDETQADLTVFYNQKGKSWTSKEIDVPKETFRLTLQNLLPETIYEIKMKLSDRSGKTNCTPVVNQRTKKSAPGHFDMFSIVECTHCSITVEWCVSDSNNTCTYALHYHLQASPEWEVLALSISDIVAVQNGRFMYKLQNLLPETCYELKMNSKNNQDRSHYTDVRIQYTLKHTPESINRLPESDRLRYNELMQSSEKENRFFVRIMIVGKQLAGKTCLLRRLLNESIADVSSTDGIDIVIHRCKINIADNKWTISKNIGDDRGDRINWAVNERGGMKVEIKEDKYREIDTPKVSQLENEKNNLQDDILLNDKDDQDDLTFVDKKHKATEHYNDMTKECSLLPTVSNYQPFVDRVNETPQNERNKPGYEIPIQTKDISTDTKKTLAENEYTIETSSVLMPDDLISHVFSKSTGSISSNLYALCELWDFAGQQEFYATHQAFLTSGAIYLVVSDMTDNISDQGKNKCFADYEDVGGYIDFWFDSIHCHRTDDELEKKHLDPPLFLVFTGKDKFDNEEKFEKRKQELDDQLRITFGMKKKYKHLIKKIFISNTKGHDEEFENLRIEISATAKKMKNWGEPLPLKWILMEHLIHINKEKGINFTNLKEMKNMSKHKDIKIQDNDVKLFLRFQHEIGNIIFFEDMQDFIILNPQWLVDAFRCLVSDKFVDEVQQYDDWVLFKRTGKISETLITKLFQTKRGSQFTGQRVNLRTVMEKLDILVKIEDDCLYIMPSKMPCFTFDKVCEMIGVEKPECKRTSWLCFKFAFLPPVFFNHLSAWLIRSYDPSQLDNEEKSLALYRGICSFNLDKSGCEKLLVTMSTDIIALQVLSFSRQKKAFGRKCGNIYNKVKQKIEEIRMRYKMHISFDLHFKCSKGYYYKDTLSYEHLKSVTEYFCPQHKEGNPAERLYLPWMTDENNMAMNDAQAEPIQKNVNDAIMYGKSERMMAQKSIDNIGEAAETLKNGFQQPTDALANIPAGMTPCSSGTNGTKTIFDTNVANPTISDSYGRENSTTATLPLNPITTTTMPAQQFPPVMELMELYLPTILKACGTSLPLVNLRQNEANYANKIGNIIDNFRNVSQAMIFGSTAEGLGTAIDRQNTNLSSSDTDIILISSDFKVYEHINEKDIVEASYPTLNHVLRVPDKTCPGYAKLAVLHIRSDLQDCCHRKGRNSFLKNTLKEKSIEFKKHYSDDLTTHDPAVNTELFPRDNASFFRHSGSSTPIYVADFDRESDYGIADTDFVFCLKGDKWPSEASEWPIRKRTYNWPTEELFDNIIKSGYFLARDGSKGSGENEIQWRVSFNIAEQLMIESFNETQIHCIMLLKLLKASQLSKVAGKNITSYTMKTIMFWSLEETSDEFWQPSNLLCCVCFCMSKLKDFVGKGFLPNYFIRERNQFISAEFLADIQTRTRQFLESFLEDPKAGISVILSTYKMHENTALPVLNAISQEILIEEWLRIRISMAQQYHATSVHSFWRLYDGYNTKTNLSRCKDVMQKLTTVMYAQPFIKLLHNCIGVLEYIRLKKKKLTVEDTTDTTERIQYLKYMKMSLSGDRTHTILRIATCYLDHGIEEECLNVIRTVTDHPDTHLFMQNYSQYVKQTLNISPIYKIHEIAMYNRIIKKDLTYQDPYKTIEEFERLKEEGHVVGGYNAFILVWERCWFDVTFTPAELPVLPKPAALELCIDNSQKKISFHPLLYGLLLEFIWHVNNCSKNEEKEKVLEKMKNCVSRISGAEQSRGLNFIIYCCSIHNDHCSASRYLIQSFKLNPIEQNVAYLYIKYIINLLRKAYDHDKFF